MLSISVVLPWSMWAMMARLRMVEAACTEGFSLSRWLVMVARPAAAA
jgi:hypothetical protein